MAVDVAINYYGKPYHTMVAIGSLLEYSGSHIDRIYLIKESQQPQGGEFITELLARHDWNVEVFTPRYFFGVEKYAGWFHFRRRPFRRFQRYKGWFALRRRAYRWSIRYQYAIEHTDKRYLFLTHNDVRFFGDVLQPMLDTMNEGTYAGVGDIGACWKCPAKAASLCVANRPSGLRLTYEESLDLYERFPSRHRTPNVSPLDQANPVPFPECRLNEWFALVDTEAYRREVKPRGSTEPLGSYDLGDVGIAWFRSMSHKGYSFAHVVGPYVHAWTPEIRERGGHAALLDRSLYEREEAVAEQYYLEHYAEK